jgi:two-component system cell cycle sensor histidine kinase/response regulator CckA
MPTILIVDDLKANRAFLVTLLGDKGHRLIEATNGSEALAAVQAEHPHLVITDVLMPVMDGYEFVRQMRLDPLTAAIPVLFYTAPYGEREARARALAHGVAYVLTKPAEAEEVLTIVGSLLSGAALPADASPLSTRTDREHLRLLTDKLSEKVGDLRVANARLRAVINIGLELASHRDSDRLLKNVCHASCDLFGATYVTLGIVDFNDHSVRRVVAWGADANWIKTGETVSGILAEVIANRRTARGDAADGEPLEPQFPLNHPEVQSFLAAPITSSAHAFGWLCLVGNEGRTFTEEDEHLLMALAAQVGRIYEVEHEAVERKQAESDLRRERDRAQRFLDTAEVMLLALDIDGRITLINRSGCALLEWTPAELLGRDWTLACVPERRRVAARETFSSLLLGDLSIAEDLILTRSGHERLIEWRNTVLRDDAGIVIGTLSSGTDITVRKETAEVTRVTEERMRFALENAGVGIWDMDFATGVLQWSEMLEAQYGLQPGTFTGTFEAFIERIHADDRSAVRDTLAAARQTGTDFSIQHRSVWPDGTVRFLSGAGRVHLGADGKPARGVGISLDVTERHTLEDQYQQAQKTEAIGRLAGGVAHDFNNLLTVILGYCELLITDNDADAARQGSLEEIQKAGIRAAGLTRQLLAYSRKEIIQPTLLDLNAVVTDLRVMLGRLIREDVKVMLHCPLHLSRVKADRGQVEQIVMNLAVNAQDAMPRGGTLTIETCNVELDEHYARTHLAVSPGSYVALTVTDTGTGMSPAVLARAFEPFFTTKDAGKGTGLGLATVHGIATRNGGSVDVKSEIGRGTSFNVYFPASDAAQPVIDVEIPPAAPRALAGETVLVVEDSRELRDLTRKLLQRQGYNVLVAADANEALAVFDENLSIDVVLTDVVMPGASGPELTRQLVERRPSTGVIYMSGYTEDAIVHHGVLRSGIAFLHKPFTSDALGRKVREVLDARMNRGAEIATGIGG